MLILSVLCKVVMVIRFLRTLIYQNKLDNDIVPNNESYLSIKQSHFCQFRCNPYIQKFKLVK